MPQIVDTSFPRHHAEITFLRKLLFDMKKQALGLQLNEQITPERIDEADKMLSQLEACRQELKIKH